MRARLLCRTGKLKGKDFEITGKLTIGRSSDNSVVIPSRLISGEHARIEFDGLEEQYFLEDLGSLNGTHLDGIPVEGRERLDRLHVISFGGAFDFIWQGKELCADLPPLASPAISSDPALRTSVDEAPPTLEDLRGDLAQKVEKEGTWSEADAVPLPAILAGPEPPTSIPKDPPESDTEGTQADVEILSLPPGLTGKPQVPDPQAPPPSAPSPDAPSLESLSPEAPGPEALGPEISVSRAVTAEAPPKAVDSQAASKEMPSSSGFVLLVTDKQRMHRVRLQAGENLVGRQEGAEVLIDNTEISRRHAVLTVSGSKVRLRDEGSRNRTYLDGEAIDGEVEVEPGSQVRFGAVEAILVLKD